MIYFSLPDFYNNLKLNNFFSYLAKNESNKFKIPLTFLTYHGNFPFNSWNGGNNNCYENLPSLLYKDFEYYFEHSEKPIRFNCTNLLLTEYDYNDNMNNVILNIFNNGCHLIEIADLKLLEFLENKYPNYRFIFSNRAHFFQEFNENIINSIVDFNKFTLIELPFEMNYDKKLLKNLNHKEKIELVINNDCPLTCLKYKECQLAEDNAQLNYSSQSPFLACYKRINLPSISLEEINSEYVPMGFTHYKFNIPHLKMKESDIILFYVKYFIKEEYQFEIFERGMKL